MSRIPTVIGSRGTPTFVGNFSPLMGQWSLAGGTARYSGALDDDIAGLALADTSLSKGSVKATITFDSDRIAYTSGGIVLGYYDHNHPCLVVELAAYEAECAIAEFVPGAKTFRKLKTWGHFTSVAPRRPYSLEIVQLGDSITVVLDRDKILEHDFATPLPGERVGLFAWGARSIVFENVSIQSAPRLFVAMPFSEPFDTIYGRVIVPCAERVGFNVVRIDELTGPGLIVEDIKTHISEAEVVLSEITSLNANVMLETGYAEGLKKPIVLLAQRGKDLPFDICSYRVILYEDSIGGQPELVKALHEHLTTVFWSRAADDQSKASVLISKPPH